MEEDQLIKIKILQEYFSTIIERDIVERQGIRNYLAMELLIKFVVNNVSRLLSFSSLKKWMNSVGVKVGKATLIEYFKKAENSFFTFRNHIFSYNIRDVWQYPVKVYVVDNGFVSALTTELKRNTGWLLENLTAIELKKIEHSNPLYRVHYWKSAKGEVDFVIVKGTDVEELIQVCVAENVEEIPEKEVNSLVECSKSLRCKNLKIVSMYCRDEIKKNGKKIKVIPAAEFLNQRSQ